jgi:hypothetical protein
MQSKSFAIGDLVTVQQKQCDCVGGGFKSFTGTVVNLFVINNHDLIQINVPGIGIITADLSSAEFA